MGVAPSDFEEKFPTQQPPAQPAKEQNPADQGADPKAADQPAAKGKKK